MTTISASTAVGIVLSAASYTNPIVIDAGVTVSNGSGDGVAATVGTWTVQNAGSIAGNGSSGFGVNLTAGGAVTNATLAAITGNGGGVEIGSVKSGGAGVVVNDGSIVGTGVSSGVGINLLGGGSVINALSAAILSPFGVYVAGAAGTVVNDGSIAGSITFGFGVYMKAGGSVTNASSATISSGGNGIDIRVGAGAVVNYGSIAGNGGAGIGLASGSVTNAPSASITAYTEGVNILGAGSVVNGGSIQADGFGIELGSGGLVTDAASASVAGEAGIKINGGVGTVVNDGSVEGTGRGFAAIVLGGGGSVTNSADGSVTGHYGVNIYGGAGVVVNDGSIVGSISGVNGAYHFGVDLEAGGSVTNAATASITGGGNGIDVNVGVGTVVNDGDVNAGATGVYLDAGGTIVNAASAAITGKVGAYMFGASTLTNAGTVVGTGGTAVAFGGTSSNLLVLAPGYGFSGLVIGSASASNTLELASAAAVGTVAGIGSSLVNFGPIDIDTGAHWSITGDTAGLAGTISGFAPDDTIVVTGVVGVTDSLYSGGILTLDVSGGSAMLDLPGSFSTTSFIVGAVTGGTRVVIACFAAGTRLLTPLGEVPVEALAPGDLVVTRSGRLRPVRWIGHRRIDLRCHPRPQDVSPVCVQADAFAPGVPHRSLMMSPDHAVFVGGDEEGVAPGVLVPVRYLCNGATIRQESSSTVVYYHVELDAHDVVLAEGLPAESYLDTGNRCAFENGGAAIQAHADFARSVWQERGCAPLVVDGPVLAEARKKILDRVAALGHAMTDDPDLRVLVDGVPVQPIRDGARLRVRLPSGARSVRLLSRDFVPAQIWIDSDDHRRLGVAIGGLAIDGHRLALDDLRLGSGWHACEGVLRWTDGDAVLLVQGARELELNMALAGRYWRETTVATADRSGRVGVRS